MSQLLTSNCCMLYLGCAGNATGGVGIDTAYVLHRHVHVHTPTRPHVHTPTQLPCSTLPTLMIMLLTMLQPHHTPSLLGTALHCAAPWVGTTTRTRRRWGTAYEVRRGACTTHVYVCVRVTRSDQHSMHECNHGACSVMCHRE